MKRKYIAMLAMAAFCVSSFTSVAFAQDVTAPADTPAANQEAPAAPTVHEKTLLEIWNIGGPTMYPIGLCCILGCALIIYNAISLRKKVFLSPEAVVELKKHLAELNIEEAIKVCETKPSPLTNIIGAGLERADEKDMDISVIERAMEEASTEELAPPFVLITYLSLIASISPMLGLLGTVSGMVKAFNTIAAEGAGSAQSLANNISEALITTAAGMIVGIPAMFFYFIYKTRYGRVSSGVNRIVGELTHIMAVAVKYGKQPPAQEEQSQA